MLGDIGPDKPVCSKRDCYEDATRSILWRNPKIHDETRTKTWLACEGHETFFLEYLGSRDFPVRSEMFVAGEH
jgi:hypothetical protein